MNNVLRMCPLKIGRVTLPPETIQAKASVVSNQNPDFDYLMYAFKFDPEKHSDLDFVVKYKRCWWGVEMSQDDFGRWHGRSRTIQPNEWLVFCGNDDGTPCDIESNQYLGEKIFNASTQGAGTE